MPFTDSIISYASNSGCIVSYRDPSKVGLFLAPLQLGHVFPSPHITTTKTGRRSLAQQSKR